MKKFNLIFAILTISMLMVACSDDDEKEKKVDPQTSYPGVVSLVAVPNDGEVELSWAATSGYYPTDYIVSYNTVTDYTGGATTYLATGLENGTQYTFSVQAVYDTVVSDAVTVTATPAVVVATGIFGLEDFLAFRDAVNNGSSLAEWQNAAGVVVLEADIDLSTVTDWTPIGNVTFDNTNLTGAIFTGTFDGQNHTIDNLTVSTTLSANGVMGLFGGAENATIRNVILGENSEIYAKSSGVATLGGILGVAGDGTTVENCTNKGTLSIEDGVSSVYRFGFGGIVGQTYANLSEVNITGCTNEGTLNATNNYNNNNGSSAFNMAGIVGFANASSDRTNYVRVTSCTNNGIINANSARAAGIVGCLYNRGAVKDCVNNGGVNNANSLIDCRTGGIGGYMQNYSYIETSTNYGTIAYTVEGQTSFGYVGGIIGQAHTADTHIEECANYGTVLSDNFKNTSGTHMGIICGYTNNRAVEITYNIVGGRIGPYVEDDTYKVVEITADNYSYYIYYGDSTAVLSNNKFGTAN